MNQIPLWASCMALWASCIIFSANAQDFKPLTRAEPIVRLVLQEANGEPFDGMVAVAGTVFDRMADPRWPDTIKAVVYQNNGRVWQYSGMALRLRRYSQSSITKARVVVGIARLGGRPCGHVLWFHNFTVYPDWAESFKIACIIGGHIFYTDRKDQYHE